jgi:hypothetical protein
MTRETRQNRKENQTSDGECVVVATKFVSESSADADRLVSCSKYTPMKKSDSKEKEKEKKHTNRADQM